MKSNFVDDYAATGIQSSSMVYRDLYKQIKEYDEEIMPGKRESGKRRYVNHLIMDAILENLGKRGSEKTFAATLKLLQQASYSPRATLWDVWDDLDTMNDGWRYLLFTLSRRYSHRVIPKYLTEDERAAAYELATVFRAFGRNVTDEQVEEALADA